MNAGQLLNKLTFVEVDHKYADEPDLRQAIRDERLALTEAMKSGRGNDIKAAMDEAVRVAGMWQVQL